MRGNFGSREGKENEKSYLRKVRYNGGKSMITLPVDFMKQLNIKENDFLRIELDGESMIIKKSK